MNPSLKGGIAYFLFDLFSRTQSFQCASGNRNLDISVRLQKKMGIKYLRNIELDATHNITFGLTVI
jgi:hypothetical protein